MNSPIRSQFCLLVRDAWRAGAFGLLLLLSSEAAVAQTCPSITLSITQTKRAGFGNPAIGPRGLDGQIEVYSAPSAPINFAIWKKLYYKLMVRANDGELVYEQTDTTAGPDPTTGASYHDWQTDSMRRPWGIGNPQQPPYGAFKLQVELKLESLANSQITCKITSPEVERTLGNPLTAASLPGDKLNMVCTANNHPSAPARSEVDPQTGNLKWAIGVTSWPYRGTTHGLAVSYASMGMIAPDNPNVPGFAGLSVKNSRWSHNYAMWVTLAIDEQAASWAVLNQSGHATTFKRNDNGTYNSRESFQTLTAGANIDPAPSVTFPCNGASVSKTVTVPSKFTLTDGAGSTYEFSTLAWQKEECTAIAHYLLTKITDRWGRELNLAWTDVTVGGGTEKRLTLVSSPGGPTLTLEYPLNDGLLRHVRLSTEPTGVKHDLGYNGVLDEGGVSRQKLTSITVRGPAGAATRARTWNFAYRVDATADAAAYGGSNSISGDLVIRKTQPDGLVISYAYQGVNLPRVSSSDYDGRAVSISWPDPESSTGKREITRAMTGANQFTMTYPGNVKTRYTYSGSDLMSMTELADTPAARTWSYTYDHDNQDNRHNLATVRSPLEPLGVDPLIEHQYDINLTTGHINGITTLQPMENGTNTPRSKVQTLFNSLNLPTQITAFRDTAAAFPTTLGFPAYEDQLTTLTFDGVGNLRFIIRRESATQDRTTELKYTTPDGVNGLPGEIINDVGAVSLFDYDNGTGLPTRAESPVNVAVGSSSPDYPASVMQTAYEEHGLPVQITDPLNRVVSLAYQAPTDARFLNVITTFGADGKFRIDQLDPMDRPNVSIDEAGVWTRWTWTPEGELKTFTRNANDTDLTKRRTTTYYRDDRGDVIAIDPPRGPSGRILFDYREYTQAGVLVTTTDFPTGIYLARPTKITYADGRTEFFGYNEAGELEWKRKGIGTLIELLRDKQHRVKSVTYPTAGGGAGFTVTTAWDEFGRVRRTTDLNGTSFAVYDNLNRPTHQILPQPQKSMDFFYLPDLTLKRWTTQIDVLGLGFYQYRADTKGRLYEVRDTHNQVFRTEHTLTGMLRQRTWPNNVREVRSYDGRDWLTRIAIFKPGGTDPMDPAHIHNRFDYSYLIDPNNPLSRDGTGHLRRETDKDLQTRSFGYNALYELVSEADSTDPLGPVAYQFDANGNRITRTQNNVTDYYGVDAANRLHWVNRGLNAPPDPINRTEPYTILTYSTNGAQSYRERRFASGGPSQALWFWWGGDDRLRKVTDIGDPADPTPFFTALYDGDGIRVKKSDWQGGPNLVAHDYSYGPQGLLWESNPATTYTPGFGHRTNNVDSFYHTDWIGSTRYVTSGPGNGNGTVWTAALAFDAWGNRTAASPAGSHPTDMQFAGAWGYQAEWSSATEPGLGLQYLQQRYYDQATGRFISPDPIGIAGGLNVYAYPSDPVGWVDPLGLEGNSVTPTVRSEITRIMARAVRDPNGARAELHDLMATFGDGVPAAAAAVLIQNAIARVDRIQAGITFIWRVGQNSYAKRLAEGMSKPIQKSCDKLIDAVSRGNLNPGIGTRTIGNIWELRASDGARVILRRVGEKSFEVLGKFQGHTRGDAENSRTIQKIIEGG